MRRALSKASGLIVQTALLYRELATSALSLLPSRRTVEQS